MSPLKVCMLLDSEFAQTLPWAHKVTYTLILVFKELKKQPKLGTQKI